MLDELHSERFADAAPNEVYATLLDEGRHLCSISTMYRILSGQDESGERRRQRVQPIYARPELLATRPNEVWSWDITRLKGPLKWMFYSLYVIMDIFSRYVVGWMVAAQESGMHAEALITETLINQNIRRDQLSIHADNGSPMTCKPVNELMHAMGVTRTHSRPHTSNDNPYSESQFRTLKYRPGFPDRFASIEEARTICHELIDWYNKQHRHTGIAQLTPEMVHFGRAPIILARRQAVLSGAYAAHPERFVGGTPRPIELPQAVYINPPKLSEPSRDG